jgi:hypothetical protein
MLNLDLDKPDGYVIGESEDCDCLRQKPYVDINVIPVARLEQQRINTTSNDTIVNCGTRSATNSHRCQFVEYARGYQACYFKEQIRLH